MKLIKSIDKFIVLLYKHQVKNDLISWNVLQNIDEFIILSGLFFNASANDCFAIFLNNLTTRSILVPLHSPFVAFEVPKDGCRDNIPKFMNISFYIISINILNDVDENNKYNNTNKNNTIIIIEKNRAPQAVGTQGSQG